MEEKQYVVYLLPSKKYGTLYTGVTSNLVQRTWQHKQGLTWASDYFDGWLPACAGTTDFFFMYRGKIFKISF